MRKALYYLSLLGCWILLVFLLGYILIIAKVEPFELNWGYTFGKVTGSPYIWLIAIGIVLLLRSLFYKWIFHTCKKYSKTTAYILICLGSVWLSINLFSSYLSNQALKKIDKSQILSERIDDYTSSNFQEEVPSLVLEDVEKQYLELSKQLNKQTPIYIDEVTELTSVTFASWNFSCHYKIHIDINDYEETDLSEFLSSIRESQKENIPRMLNNGNYEISQDELRFLFEKTGLKFRFVYRDINDNYIGANQFDYKDF